MMRLLVLTTVLLSQAGLAKNNIDLFVTHELNDTDRISTLGVSRQVRYANSNMRGEFLSAVGYAEVLDKNSVVQHFVSLDTGVRLGYYNKLYVYVEGGFDLLELLFHDFRDDDDEYYGDSGKSNNTPDGYAALGAGIDADNLRIEAYVKARNIDSDEWESQHHLFYGVQFSLSF